MDLLAAARPPTHRIAALDGLRAVLAVLITAYHLGAPGLSGAAVALPVFYALSGTLITSLLLDEWRRDGRVRCRRFVLNRSLRVLPPVLVLVAVVVVLWPVVGGFHDSVEDPVVAVAVALTWTANIARASFDVHLGVLDPLWSLAAEEQFYVVWPAVFAVLVPTVRRRRALVVALLVAIVLGPVATAPVFEPPTGASAAAVYYAPLISTSSLASGCLGALVLDRLRRQERWSVRRARTTTWCGAALLLTVAGSFDTGWKSDPVLILAALPMAGAVSAVLVAGLGTSDTLLSRALGWRPLAWYGARASYSLYIWHMTVFALLSPVLDGVVGRAVVLVVAVAVGAALGLAVEQPADRFRRWALRPRDRHPHRHISRSELN